MKREHGTGLVCSAKARGTASANFRIEGKPETPDSSAILLQISPHRPAAENKEEPPSHHHISLQTALAGTIFRP